MPKHPILSNHLSSFMEFLAAQVAQGDYALPSLNDLSEQLGMSISTLREELKVARAMGLVDVKPRVGIKSVPYSFTPGVTKSLAYAVSIDRKNFIAFSDLRSHTEASYWYQAVSNLTEDDIGDLHEIIRSAERKLQSDPIQVPHTEHRNLHLTIFKRLDNIFVKGILEAYWDIYEAVGLNVYEDRSYLDRVWNYHKQMVESIANHDFLAGYQAMIAHVDLLFQREQKYPKIPFE